MSGRRAKALRRAAGNPPKKAKTPTPLLEVSYIQAPVGYDDAKKQYRYRSPKKVRKYLERRGVDVVALQAELEALMAEYVEAAETKAEEVAQ